MEDTMGNELAVVQQREARLAIPAPEFSNEQIKTLGRDGGEGVRPERVGVLLAGGEVEAAGPVQRPDPCGQALGLSLGKEKISVQVGVDGYRAIASRLEIWLASTIPSTTRRRTSIPTGRR